MKKIITALLLIVAITSINAQEKKFEIGLFSGLNLPTGDFNNHYGFAEIGINNGLHFDYYPTKSFGFGIDARHSQNKTDSQEFIKNDIQDFANVNPSFFPASYTIASSTITEIASGSASLKQKWETIMVTLGPTYRLQFGQSKFGMEAFVKAGIAWVKSPSYATQYVDASVPANIIMFDANPGNVNKKTMTTTIGVAGLRFNYNMSKDFALSLAGDYTKTFNMNYKYDYFNITTSGDNGGVPAYTSPTDIPNYEMNQRLQIKSIGINLGVKYKF